VAGVEIGFSAGEFRAVIRIPDQGPAFYTVSGTLGREAKRSRATTADD
jgi:hypothetical protein